ncbi:MAG: hydrogenase nickel incorporation protein HypA [Candidatus Bipolaricaulota bacterium]|nr:hydrogenase nickel incorporation protein HypA [Candidatus Bipolaricaulota bacterium]MDW8329029.1 hydrogenase nickel incorporation protein HypA [Candidatus Bipolaricaulota bacterium]
MHEWALAEAVVATAKRAAREQQLRRVTGITVRLGELQQIEREIFKFALEQMLAHEDALVRDAKVVVERESARFRCRVCHREWDFQAEELGSEIAEAIHFIPEVAHAYLRCPSCRSPDFDVMAGRGVWLASLEGEE